MPSSDLHEEISPQNNTFEASSNLPNSLDSNAPEIGDENTIEKTIREVNSPPPLSDISEKENVETRGWHSGFWVNFS